MLIDAADGSESRHHGTGRRLLRDLVLGDGDVRSRPRGGGRAPWPEQGIVFPGMAGDDRLREWMTTAEMSASRSTSGIP